MQFHRFRLTDTASIFGVLPKYLRGNNFHQSAPSSDIQESLLILLGLCHQVLSQCGRVCTHFLTAMRQLSRVFVILLRYAPDIPLQSFKFLNQFPCDLPLPLFPSILPSITALANPSSRTVCLKNLNFLLLTISTKLSSRGCVTVL